MLRKLRNHINRWNKWRKGNINSRLHKFLVLIGLRHSPTFELVFSDEFEKWCEEHYYTFSSTEPLENKVKIIHVDLGEEKK